MAPSGVIARSVFLFLSEYKKRVRGREGGVPRLVPLFLFETEGEVDSLVMFAVVS